MAWFIARLKNPTFISILIYLLLSSIAAFKLFGDWVVVFGDIDFGFASGHYLQHLFPVRNDFWSTSNFFNLPRILFVYPFFQLFYKLWNDWLFERSLFIGTIWLSWISMICLCQTIFKFYWDYVSWWIQKYRWLVIWLIIAWLLYALNPYTLIRLHHFYLYVGYAIFPLVLRWLIELYWLKRRDYTLKSIFSLQSICVLFVTAWCIVLSWAWVHYIVFSFIVIGILWIYHACDYIKHKEYQNLFLMTLSMIILTVIFFGLLSYFVLPYIQASSIPDFWPKNINTKDTVNLFSRFSTFSNVLLLKSYRRPMYDYNDLGGSLEVGWWIMFMFILGWLISHRKYRWIKRIACLLLWLIVASTWTYYRYIAPAYIYLVFNSPISGALWFVFRDPNKLLWLIVLIYSGIIAWTLRCVVEWLLGLDFNSHYIKYEPNHILRRVISIHYQKIKNWLYLLIIWFILAWCWLYVFPVTFEYMKYFYYPISAPQEYQSIKKLSFEWINDTRSIYFPRYEKEKPVWYDFAVTSWNNKEKLLRPTWSADIYSIPFPTYHPLEWNDDYLNHFYDFIGAYLTNGYGRNLAPIFQSLNIRYFFYHNDILGREAQGKKELYNLAQQTGLTQVLKNGFMTIWDAHTSWSSTQKLSPVVYDFGWIRNRLWCLYYFSNKSSKICQSHVFTKQQLDSSYHTWDIAIVDDQIDYQFQSTADKIMVTPFDSINSSNARIWRSKTRTTSSEWLYYIDYLHIINYIWDFDYWKWLIFSFAPSRFTIPSYDSPLRYGKSIFDLHSILDISQLFIWWDDINETNISFAVDKKTSTDSFRSVKWSLIKWDSQIWRIGNTKFFDIKPNNWYWFKLKVSGLNISKLHLKVKYFDDTFNELSVWYISVPDLMTNYEHLTLTDSFISPQWARYMQLQFSSLENPAKKSFWWLHDMEIRDLSEITVPNDMEFKQPIMTWWLYDVYVRSFNSSHWWVVKIGLWNTSYYTTTYHAGNGKFDWQYVWEQSYTTGQIITWSIQNIEGFNAINIIWFKPKKQQIPFSQQQIILQEAELNSTYTWNIQAYKHYLQLSNWKSVNVNSWSIIFDFDILRSGIFDIRINTNFFNNWNASIQSHLVKDGQSVSVFQWSSLELWTLVYDTIYMSKWHYRLVVDTVDKNPSLVLPTMMYVNTKRDSWVVYVKEDSADTEKRKLFYQIQDAIPESYKIHSSAPRFSSWTELLEDQKWCSFYYDWKKSDYSILYQPNWFTIDFKTWYDCKWLIVSHDMIKVRPDNEYLVSFMATKFNTKKLHTKVQFFTASWVLIPTKDLVVWNDIQWKNIKINNQLFDLEFWYTDWTKKYFQDIVTTPENAAFMKVERRQKQRQDFPSKYIIDNLTVKEYKSLPWIDSLVVLDSNVQLTGSKDLNQFIQQNTPYTPLRKIKNHDTKPVRSNLFMNWFLLTGQQPWDILFDYIPNKWFHRWKIISISFFILGSSLWLLLWYRRYKRY